MTVDPAVELVLSLVNAPGSPGLEELDPPEARELYANLALLSPNEGAEVASVIEQTVAGVPCQIVTPLGDGPFPVLVWFHGGGWVIGSAALSLGTCRDLAAAVGCIVVDVDYRLAPEHPFPAGPDDCHAVAAWVLEHASELGGDPSRVAVGGDSAGGNLAAAIANELPGLVFQVLVYPATDLTLSYPSMDENGEGYLLTKAAMTWFRDHYLAEGDPKLARSSPLYADEGVLAAAPPAVVITAELDPLRDEGEAYADRLRAAGVAVEATRYDGQIHGFFSMATILPQGQVAVDQASAALRKAFGS
jgi:acetyl esterase